MDIGKELSENQAILIVMQSLNYSKSVISITKNLGARQARALRD
jgi:hypothetical protein